MLFPRLFLSAAIAAGCAYSAVVFGGSVHSLVAGPPPNNPDLYFLDNCYALSGKSGNTTCASNNHGYYAIATTNISATGIVGRTEISANQSSPGEGDSAEANVDSTIDDYLRITGRTGTGFLRFFMTTEASSAGAPKYATVYAAVKSNFGTITGSAPSSGIYILPFTFGTPINIFASVSDSISNDGYHEFNINYHKFSVLDSIGRRINGLTYTSRSGLDYEIAGGTFAAIPEPSTYLLLGSGLGLLFWRKARR